MEFDKDTKANLDMWLEGDVGEEIKTEIQRLIQANPQEVIDAFYTKLSFGTGGLRGVMGVGTNRMNRYTVRIATQGLANYINRQSAPTEGHAVFIGYDSRNHSRDFAEEAARVLAANNIRVFLCNALRPTPLVSFGCRWKQCSAAIMVTASHNPPQYNGYKVYWNDGAQVVPPHDAGIIEEVQRISDFSQVKCAESAHHPLIVSIGSEVDEAYLHAIERYQSYPRENSQQGSNITIVYSSLHGTGMTLVPSLLKRWGFSAVVPVEEQCEADGNFPTVKSPNPEEREALALGIQKMKDKNADILIATDPDADRVGTAVMHEGEPVMLNGNQIACVCLYHICNALSSQNRMPEKAAFVKTIATTELFKEIAESFGGTCFDVLTGFKYVAEKMRQWEEEKQSFQFVFGGEESYGYLLGTHARDKDAVISSALLCEAALHAKLQGKTLIDLLHEIYRKFGVYYEVLKAITFEESRSGREQMDQGLEIFHSDPPKEISGTAVVAIENFLKSEKKDLRTGETSPITLPQTNALLFWLEDRTKILIRPSGTEPKIKLYCGVVQKEFSSVSEALDSCKERAEKYLEGVQAIF